MLPKAHRLRRKKEIERVFKEGEGFREDSLFLKLVRNDFQRSRFCFIVSQKVSKKAVLRNKIKRRLREIVRRKLEKIKKGFDVILMALPGLEKKDFWEMEEIINNLFEKAKLFEIKK